MTGNANADLVECVLRHSAGKSQTMSVQKILYTISAEYGTKERKNKYEYDTNTENVREYLSRLYRHG